MTAAIALDSLLLQRRVWKGQPTKLPPSNQPTGHSTLDAALPASGWPESALIEILVAGAGLGELQLLWPTLARLTGAAERVVLVAPPFIPYAPAWQAAGIDLRHLAVVEANGRDALWAAEQCLRSGSCGAVLCWPSQADDRTLRRLQLAATSGQTLAFAYRQLREAANPSPAVLRLALEGRPAQVRLLKCRGGQAGAEPIRFATGH
ncbi:translesion DNA synthesis-associated protein ImuA [Pseudomonas sp. CrR25]|nr:translesion DNA synthesis-associated protein ImuA [Pseudomonas sp. CrR25]